MKNCLRILAACAILSMLATGGAALAAHENPTAAESQTPPDLPEGQTPRGQTPPDLPEGQAPDEQNRYALTGVLCADGENAAYDGSTDGSELASDQSDESVILAKNGANLSVSNVAIGKTGDTVDSDATDFYAVNAVVAAAGGSTVELRDAILESSAQGGNCLFATGENSTIYAQNATLHSAKNNSRGLDATFGGTIAADNLEIDTEGDHSGAVATDRGNGFISIANSTLRTAGQGSPLIYSTGTIEAINVTGESTGAQIVGMEGLNKVRLRSCDLTGSGRKASEPVANGVFLYQSMSGDSSEGEALFESQDSILSSSIDGGSMFYITNTRAEVVLKNTVLNFDAENNALITVGGNSANGWGTPGENGGVLKFTAIGEVLKGNVVCDGISTAELYLTEESMLTGAILRGGDFEGDGGASLHLSSDSQWIVTADSALVRLSMPEGASILDADGRTVSVVGADGAVYVSGDSPLTVTVESFTAEDLSAQAGALSDLEIDRSHFEA